MSCLPDLFIPSKSQPLNPHKIGGPFSLHLRSNTFALKDSQQPQTNSHRLFQSGDNKRYRSWMDTDRSFRTSKRSSRSFFHKERENRDVSLMECNPQCENINNQTKMQSELEAVSNFKAMKKMALEQSQLALKTIQMLKEEKQAIREELTSLKNKITTELDDLSEEFRTATKGLHFAFKQQRRQSITDFKTINKQLTYLSEQTALTRQMLAESSQKFTSLSSQFF